MVSDLPSSPIPLTLSICRCELNDFVLSKSHKKILKTMNKFLKDGVKVKEGVAPGRDEGDDHRPLSAEDDQGSMMDKEYQKSATRDLPNVKMNTRKDSSRTGEEVGPSKAEDQPKASQEERKVPREEQGHPKKKKLMRLERRQAKLAAKGLPLDSSSSSSSGASSRKTVQEFLSEEPKDGKHKLKVRDDLNYSNWTISSLSVWPTCR